MTDTIDRLCERLALGAQASKVRPVTGGLLHRAWRVQTRGGLYFFKRLQPAITRRPGALERYRAAERLAHALAGRGVPAVAALAIAGDPMHELDGAWWQVFPWVEGATLAPEAITVAHARAIGAALAAIHGAAHEEPGLGELEVPFVVDSTWTELTRGASANSATWAASLAGARGDLRSVAARAASANESWKAAPVASHRDLDTTNVLWRPDGAAAIVDWESAGRIVPALEVVRAAFDWSETDGGVPDRERFVGVIQSYRQAGGVCAERADALVDAALGAMQPWLAYCLRDALGASAGASKKSGRSHELAGAALAQLRARFAHREAFVSWLKKALAA